MLVREEQMVLPAAVLPPLLLLLASSVAAASATPISCPADFTLMVQTANWTVCEDLSQRTGSLLFLAPDGSTLALLNKTAEAMYNPANVTGPVHPPALRKVPTRASLSTWQPRRR